MMKTISAMPISTHPCLCELNSDLPGLSDGAYCTGEKRTGSHVCTPLLDLPSTAMKIPAKKKKEDNDATCMRPCSNIAVYYKAMSEDTPCRKPFGER